MNSTRSIAQRLKQRKVLLDKMIVRKESPSTTTSVCVDLSDESKLKGKKQTKRKAVIKRSGKNHAPKNRSSNKKMHYGSGEHCDDDSRRWGKAYCDLESDDSSNGDARELVAIDNCVDTRRGWISRGDGIEMLCEKEFYNLTTNPKAKPRIEQGRSREESEEYDGRSDSEPEFEVVYPVTASRSRMNCKSKSRSNNNNVKRTIDLGESGQRGMGYKNITGYKNLTEEHLFEKRDAFQGKNSGDEDHIHSHSLAGKNSKNTAATNGEDQMKCFIRTAKKGSKKVEKTLEAALSDSSQDASSSSDTETDDPDDEDFKVGISSSSASEEYCSSLADEGDERDEEDEVDERDKGDKEQSSAREVIVESSDEKVSPRKKLCGEKKEKSCGKKRKRTCGRSEEIQEENHADSKHESNSGCEDHQTRLENTHHESNKRNKAGNSSSSASEESCSSLADKGDGGDERDERDAEDEVNERGEGDKEQSSAREVIVKSSDEKGSPKEKSCGEKKEKSCGKKRKRTCGRSEAIREENHADSKHESNSGCEDHQTVLENTHNESNKSTENFKGKETKQQPKKEKVPGPKQNDFVNALINSIIGNGEMLEEQPQQTKEPEEAKLPPSKGFTLPLNFRFEDEDPIPVEKSEHEIMVDALFDELVMADMCSLEDDSKTENPSIASEKCTHPCSGSARNHELYIDEEIGLICRHCGHVEREMRYIDPDFAPNVGRKTWSQRSGDRQKLPGFNGLDFSPGEADFGDSFNAANGTVWEAIPGAKSKLYEHQQEGFEFLWKNLEGTIDLAELKNSDSREIGGCIISHAPGTGKTLLTIVFLRTYLRLFPSSRPVIIAPASMLLTWEEEFRKWNVDFPFHNVNNLEFSGEEQKKLLDDVSTGGHPGKDVIRLVKIYSWSKEKSILGISYNLFESLVGGEYRKRKGNDKGLKENGNENSQSENFRKILLELPRLIVLDEGHTPRNQRSCIWNTLLKIQTERRIILTGTPFQNNFGELFNTLRLVRPATAELLSKEKTFADMITARGVYSQRSHNKQMGSNCYSSSRDEAVDRAIERLKSVITPFVHVHKGTILQRSLPGLKDSVILLNPPPLQRQLIRLIEVPRGHSSFEYDHKLALISTHPSLMNHCCLNEKERAGIDVQALEKLRPEHREGVKTRFVMELIRLSIGMQEKVLVFSQYMQVLKLLAEQITARFGWEEGGHVIQMHGKQKQEQRQNIITKFNDPRSEAIVLLASTKCCSEGINLVGASRVVLLDVVWNPSVERQAISRAYRLGQQKVVHTYHLMAAGTTEGDKYCRQVEKDRLSELVFSSSTQENVNRQHVQNPASAFDDIILQKMLGDATFKDVFEKIIYQPKEANLITSFALASQL